MAFKPTFTREEKEKISKRKMEEKKLEKESQEELITLQEERVFREGVVTIRDLIAPAGFKVESNFIKLGDLYCRTLFITAYPRYIAIGWSSPLINMSMTMDISMFFYPVKSAVILKH